MKRLAILGIDPGFASIGVAALVLDGQAPPRVEHFAVFHTEQSAKKHKRLATEDNLRRATEIGRFFRQLIASLSERAIVAGISAEAMSFPRNASAAAKVAMAWGALALLSEATSIPIIQSTPQQLKVDVCGKKTASKEEIQAAMLAVYPEIGKMRAGIRETDWEHPHDALAAAHVGLSSEAVAMARRVL